MMLGLVLSLGGLLHFLLVLAVIVLAVIIVKWLLGLAGLNPPPAVWAVVAAIIVIVLLIWLLGGVAFTS